MVELPFADVKKKMASLVLSPTDQSCGLVSDNVTFSQAKGTAVPSFTFNALQAGEAPDEIVKWTAGTMYAAGSDTVRLLNFRHLGLC